ncbi:MAG: DUF6504 family protein [bacterium]
MARQYAVPVTGVALAARRPMRFTWQGRGYVVTSVLGHWVTGASWWRAPERVDADTHTWRIEASSGPRSGIYDLSCSGDRWSLRRMA